MNYTKKYVSVFKIDGVPILPPLITEAKRVQLSQLKEMAVANETKVKTANLKTGCNNTVLENNCETYSQYSFIYDNLNNENCFELPTPPSSKEIPVLQKSETFMFDIQNNTVFIPITNHQEFLISSDNYTSNSNLLSYMCDELESESKLGDESNLASFETFKARSGLPNINVLPPTPLNDDKSKSFLNEEELTNYSQLKDSEYRASTARPSSTSPSFKTGIENENSTLIRSNSFTLDAPSPGLLRHLVGKQLNQVVFQETENSDLIRTDNKPLKNETSISVRIQKIVLPEKDTDKPKNLRKEQKKNLPLKNTGHKSKKSPYESKPTKMKMRRQKTPLRRITNSISPREENNTAKKSHEMLLEIEKRHILKMKELLNQQKDEQTRLEEDFKKQQKLLLLQLNQDITSLKVSSDKNELSEEIGFGNNSYNNIEPISLDISLLNKKHATQEQAETLSVHSSRCSRKLFAVSPKDTVPLVTQKCREKAATLINAYTRGYLVRRLFKTERIKRIIQTIQETIIFVLHLYRETGNLNETSEHVTLKSLLSQQLTSACYDLHNIFFKLSTKERMEIIAKDRAHILRKTIKKI